MSAMTTLVVLVGSSASETLRRIDAANVSGETVGDLPEDPTEASRLLSEVWRRARRHSAVYTLVDVDPLAVVVSAWAERLRGGEDRLELAIGLVADASAPDYYLVDPTLPDPEVHWYTGKLISLAPSRVVLTSLSPSRVLDSLANLPAGRELPDLKVLAEHTRAFVPVPGVQPLTTPSGRSRATGRANPANSHASTTSSTSLYA
ncbi:MAG: hypothetical protein KatS3mg011_1127 [Acidimicrobiia bacterium]|nr:MAG: hypothetical protein KatS3mg011_1127 [Acidimicrobiia bacterium]